MHIHTYIYVYKLTGQVLSIRWRPGPLGIAEPPRKETLQVEDAPRKDGEGARGLERRGSRGKAEQYRRRHVLCKPKTSLSFSAYTHTHVKDIDFAPRASADLTLPFEMRMSSIFLGE